MRKLGEAFYGRGKALTTRWRRCRTAPSSRRCCGARCFGGAATADAARLADYVLRAEAALAGAPTERVLAGEIDWPAPA